MIRRTRAAAGERGGLGTHRWSIRLIVDGSPIRGDARRRRGAYSAIAACHSAVSAEMMLTGASTYPTSDA
jgi:hypothetical protein